MYKKDTLSALDAITEAQRIAFAPMLFQTALCLRNSGVLDYLDHQGKLGATLEAICEHCEVNEYAVSVLLDMGLSGRILTHKEGQYYLAKVGHFLLHDAMTRVNMDFTQDVCYQGLFFLENALQEGKPSGLKVFGDWPTIYPALSQLPQAARKSWFAFDHYYSDGAFNAALPYVFASQPATLYDVGGNTGKWALRCCQYDENIAVTLLDLPQQIALAREKAEKTLEDNEIIQSAKMRAEEIINQSRQESEISQREADNYILETLTGLELHLDRLITQVRNGIKSLQDEIYAIHKE